MSDIKILTPREMPLLSDEQALDMYGVDKEGLVDLFEQIRGPADAFAVQMLAMGILSDAQHVMQQNPNRARQFINKAKWLMDHVQSELRSFDF